MCGDRSAVKWTDWPTGRPQQSIKPLGLFERTRIDRDQRIDERAAFVIGLNAIKISLRDGARSGLTGDVSCFKIGYRGLYYGETGHICSA